VALREAVSQLRQRAEADVRQARVREPAPHRHADHAARHDDVDGSEAVTRLEPPDLLGEGPRRLRAVPDDDEAFCRHGAHVLLTVAPSSRR
jgi:hypothetical protein